MTPASGTGAGALSVAANTTGLAAGTYTGTVTVTAAGASGSPKTVAVTLTVNPAAARAQWAPGASTRRPGRPRTTRPGACQQRDDHRRHTHDRGPDRLRAHLRRRERLGHGARRRLARPHEPGDARGVGLPDRARQRLADRAAEGAARPARVRALREQRPHRPSRPPVHDRRPVHERDGGAAAEHVDAPRDDLGRHDAAALGQRHTGGHARRRRHAAEQHRASCASAGTTSGPSGSRAGSTRSVSTTARSLRPSSRPT